MMKVRERMRNKGVGQIHRYLTVPLGLGFYNFKLYTILGVLLFVFITIVLRCLTLFTVDSFIEYPYDTGIVGSLIFFIFQFWSS